MNAPSPDLPVQHSGPYHSQEHNFALRADAIGLRYAPAGRIETINIGSGRATSITVYRAGGTP